MATIKVHAVQGSNRGTESCDFRGDKFIGKEQGDHHRTIFEQEFGPDVITNDLIELVIRDGPAFNRMANTLLMGMKPAGPLGQLLDIAKIGDNEFLRLGVWDD